MPSYSFHPDALTEYSRATSYYLRKGGSVVAAGFVAEVEAGIAKVLRQPETWRIAEEPAIRRYLLRRFPYAIYYQWRKDVEAVTIYAVMDLRKRPGYWLERLSS
jgi:toxin ParE1/3/4